MNLLQISLTNKCNKACEYCPVARWRNNPEHPDKLTNERLLPLLDDLNPSAWAVELTGGEPALYPGINELLEILCSKGFSGLVKTNGSLPIRKVPSFKMVAAFHDLLKRPYFFDEILIIEHTPDFAKKVEWCLENEIPYRAIENDAYWRATGKRKPTGIERIMFVNPAGDKCECKGDAENRVPLEDARLPHRKPCPECKSAIDFEIFFNQREDALCYH